MGQTLSTPPVRTFAPQARNLTREGACGGGHNRGFHSSGTLIEVKDSVCKPVRTKQTPSAVVSTEITNKQANTANNYVHRTGMSMYTIKTTLTDRI